MNPPLLLLIAVLVSLSGLSAQGQKTVPEMVDSVEGAAESAAGPKAKAADVLTPKAGQVKVRGLVEDAEGRPLAGARLILGSGETLDAQAALDTPVGVADAEGKFELHLQAHADAQAAKQHAYLLAVAPGRVAVRVRMPTLRYTTDVSWGAAKNAVQERALQGLDLMARLWGRKTQRKPAGVDLKRIVLCRGVVLRGLVTDAAGEPIEGVRVSARDLLATSRFRGMAKSGEHWSYARTRSDGTFVLPGVLPTGSVLKLVKPGYCDSSRTLVWSEDLVKISMREATKVAGKVLGSDGKPASGKVRVVYEVSSDTHEEALGDGGVFGVELKHPHRYRLVVTPSGACAKHSISTYSAILSGGHEAQLITLDAKPKVIKKKAAQKAKVKPEPKLGFPASVIDESSELPIKTFKAGTIWVNPNYAKHGPYLIAKGMPKLKSNKQPGYIRLQPPNSPSLQHGGVLVQAKGYAVNLTMLEWDEQAPPRLEIKMVPESVLSGVVRDGDTGEPISGAPVTYYSFTEDRGKRWTNKVTADKAGRFLVRGLRAGHYLLMVAYKGRQAAAQAIDLAVGEERKDLEFQVPSSAVVRGRIQGIEIGDRWEVQLITEGSYRSLEYNPVYRPTGVKVALGKDGAFEIPEVQPGYYEVCVRIPQGAREGGDFLIPIEPIRVRERSLDLDLDASLDRPGSIRGKVTIHGAAIDPARLLVVASPSLQSTPFMLSYGGNVDLSGSRCQVRPDQTFALNAAPGFLGIRVIDMLTGVTLFSSEHPVKLRSGSQMVFDPRLALAVVRVKIEAKTPGASTAASWLDIDVVNAGLSDMAWAFNSGGSDSKKATGISLLGHQGELALLLPPRKVTLRVRSEASRLARPKLKIRNILGEAELTPRVGEQNQVQIQVTVPMTGFDPDPAPKAEGVEGDKAERARKGAGIKVPAVMRVGKV